MEKPFNATFFATVAVVLPIIFLALALQSDYLARTMVASQDMLGRSLYGPRPRKGWWATFFASYRLSSLSGLLLGAVVLVMFYGIYGEMLSLRALEQRQAMLSTQTQVMWAAGALIVAAVIASVWRVGVHRDDAPGGVVIRSSLVVLPIDLVDAGIPQMR